MCPNVYDTCLHVCFQVNSPHTLLILIPCSDYEPDEAALKECHRKLYNSFELFEIGVTPLEAIYGDFNRSTKTPTLPTWAYLSLLVDHSISMLDLKALLQFHLKLSLTVQEVVSLANDMRCTEGRGTDTKVLLKSFIPLFKRVVDNNRSCIRYTYWTFNLVIDFISFFVFSRCSRESRRKEQEELEASRAQRAAYSLATYDKQVSTITLHEKQLCSPL